MREFFDQYGTTLLAILAAVISINLIFGLALPSIGNIVSTIMGRGM